MTRKEFFGFPPIRWWLHRCGCFSVNRQGIPVSSIRKAIGIARNGEVVGICPEGGRAMGANAAFRGGRIKRGVCSVAIRSQTPVVPCVMLGTPALNRIKPWLPFKHATLWVAYGDPLTPPAGKSTRVARDEFRDQLGEAYKKLYIELCDHFGLQDAAIP
jgi:1-acyl-sn-glycerol-3-phosphate acyltransferase